MIGPVAPCVELFPTILRACGGKVHTQAHRRALLMSLRLGLAKIPSATFLR